MEKRVRGCLMVEWWFAGSSEEEEERIQGVEKSINNEEASEGH